MIICYICQIENKMLNFYKTSYTFQQKKVLYKNRNIVIEENKQKALRGN